MNRVTYVLDLLGSSLWMDHTCAMRGGPQQFIFENRHKGTPWGQGVSCLGGSVAAGGKGDRPLYAPGNIHGSSTVCWASSPRASALRLRLPPLGLTSPASLQATFPGSESGLPNQICDCFTVLVQIIQEWTSGVHDPVWQLYARYGWEKEFIAPWPLKG